MSPHRDGDAAGPAGHAKHELSMVARQSQPVRPSSSRRQGACRHRDTALGTRGARDAGPEVQLLDATGRGWSQL
jgi:hypothetical protein